MADKKLRNLVIGLIMIVLLAMVCVLLPTFMNQDQQKIEEFQAEKERDSIVLSLAPDQIRKISYTQDGGAVTFEQSDGRWRVPGDSAFEMNPSRIKLLTNDLAALKTDRILDRVTDLEQYGLGDSAKIIQITAQNDSVTELYTGIRNPSTKQLYFRMGEDRQTVYLTTTALDQHFSGTANEYAVYESFPTIKPASIRKVVVRTAETSYILNTPGDDTCSVEDESGEVQQADLQLAGVLQNTISNLSWIENIEYNCKDFAVYGLKDPQAVVEISYLETGKTVRTVLSVGKRNAKGYYYVRLNDSAEVHTVREEYLKDILERTAASFWSRSYSFVSIGDIDRLEVTAGGETHILRRDATDGQEERWLVDEHEVEKTPFTDFYYECASVTAQERLQTVPKQQEAPVLALDYVLLDGTHIKIVYYTCDQNFYTVVYDNETKAALTNKIYVNNMLEKLQKLLDSVNQ